MERLVGPAARRGRALAAGALLLALIAPLGRASATEPTVAVTVRVEPGTSIASTVSELGGTIRATDPTLGTVTASLPPAAMEALRLVPGVVEVTTDVAPNPSPVSEWVAPERAHPLGFVRGDHGHGEGGGSFTAVDLPTLARIADADRAWASTTGSGVDVALIDTGVAPVPGVGTVVNGPDLSLDGPEPGLRYLDAYGHGTHLAGIINGRAGLAPSARLVNVKVGSANGAVDVSQVIAALDWVVQHRESDGLNIRVLVLAYGTDGVQPYTIDPLAAAVENAWRNGIVVVVAAGNRGQATTSLDNPALDPFVLAVGASESNGTYSTADDTVAPFTNRGSATRGVDLLAPGRSIVSLRVPGSYADLEYPEGRVGTSGFRGSGTSQAAAVVGAAAALILEDRPSLTPDEVKWLLTSTARSLPRVSPALQGAGIVDVAAAVNRPMNRDAEQTWTASSGTGTIEGARGTVHLLDPSGALVWGEIALPAGSSWSGSSWTGASWSGTSWSGGSWSGSSWSGSSWSGGTWLGSSWSGSSWSGSSWSGSSWSGNSWSGSSWSGSSWSGSSWSNVSWSGTSWSGTSWSGTSWSGTTGGA